MGFVTDSVARDNRLKLALRTATRNAKLELAATKNHTCHLQPKTGIIVNDEDECIHKSTVIALEPIFLSRKFASHFVRVDTHSDNDHVFGMTKDL